ncbi:leucine-rich repeat-containing protein 4-like [Haliotis asinina]|uniref:leucine-rich repeat-containing protein 4-like n=1 Tax=Haliotis asinina TaxID=109174 RepID=UPI003531B6E8
MSLYVVLGLVITTGAAQSCPTGCVCPIPGHVSCTGLSSFPQSFPTSTEVVTIYLSSLPEIPPDSFKGLPLLNTVTLYKNTIGKIKNCAFKNLAQIKSMNIYQSTIDTIESGAFSDMSFVNPGSFALYSISIGDIQPYAFSSLSDPRFSIYSANVTIIRPFAFHNISARSFSLYQTNIDFMDTSAFEDFNRTKSASIYSSYIANLHCNTLDVLQEDVGNVFSFYQLTFNCSCQLAWLFDVAQTNRYFAASLGRNRCHDNSTVLPGRRLNDLNATLLCPAGRESSQCLKPELSFPSQCTLPGAPTQSSRPSTPTQSPLPGTSRSSRLSPHVLGCLLTLVIGVFLKNQLK